MRDSSVVSNGKAPPQRSVFPTRVELTLIARIEDHYQYGDRMDELLREWHHIRDLPLSAIALIWAQALGQDISVSWLEYLAERYGVDIRAHDSAVLEAAIAAGEPIASVGSPEPFGGIGRGIVAQRILHLWQHDHSWSRVLSRLYQQDNRVTLSWLQSFVVQQGAAFVNLVRADDLRSLFANDGLVVIEALPLEAPEQPQPAAHQKRKRTARSAAPRTASSDRPKKTDRAHGLRDEDRSLDLYLREIGETSLIDAPEEVRLAQRIKQGDKKAHEKLVKANLRFVVSVAKQYQNQGLSLGDLINEGNIGLIKAAWRFDETRGFKFISYGVWWIRQAILQALAENSRIVRLPLNRVGTLHKIHKTRDRLTQVLGRDPTPDEIAIELALSEDEVDYTMSIASTHLSLDKPLSDELGSDNLIDRIEDTSSVSADQSYLTESLRAEIEKALDTLTPREAEVLNLYFGLNHEHALTLEEIGAQFALTRERVRQIKEKAIRRMRHASRSRSLRSYLTAFDQGGND